MSYSQADKLQLLMLCDIYRELNIENSFNPDVIEEAISTNNYWALSWNNEALGGNEELPNEVKFVVDAIEMYLQLEYTYSNMSEDDKAEVAKEIPHFSPEKSLSFPGFYINRETKHYQIAKLLKMLNCFDGTDITLNSHIPSVDTYRRMLTTFLPARDKFVHNIGIPKQDFINTFLERIHPENR